MFEETIEFIRQVFEKPDGFIPLHEPFFNGNEKKYVLETLESTFVSSAGEYVNRFEEMMTKQVGTEYAIAVVNGTSALHMALKLVDVKPEEEVITQSLTFVATANAISYLNAQPVFVDVDRTTLGLSPDSLRSFLEKNTRKRADGFSHNLKTGRRIAACVPMHTFGFPARIDQIIEVCNEYNIPVVEDAAESSGSRYLDRPLGSFGKLGIFSFNGNKTITCGGGGAIVTNDGALYELGKHLTTTAKTAHQWEYIHDQVGFNYRLPNLNAALACAQLEQLPLIVEKKRDLAHRYKNFFESRSIDFHVEPDNSYVNYWLNTLHLSSISERDTFLTETNENSIMTRPVWRLISKLPMYRHCQTGDLSNSLWLEARLVNIPSSVLH